MKKRGKIYAIIPARGGSKSIPRKNILSFGGYPLVAFSIAAAKLAKKIDRIIVSTDDEKIARVAKKFGAEVPFMRPKEISGDLSTDREFFVHAIKWFEKAESEIPELMVHLRPTSPLRDPKHIDQAIDMIHKDAKATSLRSAYEVAARPQKFFLRENGYFVPLIQEDKKYEYHLTPRQMFPAAYNPDGYLDIVRSSRIFKNEDSLHGNKILAFVSHNTGDIDHTNDLAYAEKLIADKEWLVYEYLKRHFPQDTK